VTRGEGSQASVSVVLPCLDEAANVGRCVEIALAEIERLSIDGEVIVVDNGSTDGSPELAEAAGARVIREPRRGYGQACATGAANARGEYIVLSDADLSYDLTEIGAFVGELDGGADLVLGNRMANIHPGAMPWSHRWIGNPLMSGTLRLLFRPGIRDAWCGLRAIRRDALERLQLRNTGMQYSLEMVIRASQIGLDIRERPIELHPRHGGESKMGTISDGWRGMSYMVREWVASTRRPRPAGARET
jgi:glycosyltransferase involved in cell wall biosynthesis